MRMIRWTAWILVVLFVGATIALYASDAFRTQVAEVSGSGRAAVGGEFTMVNDDGETVTQEAFLGRPTVYFFGFTHCPDVCPTALFELSNRMEELGADADRMNAVFVTVDPERDTPEELHRYLQAFDPRITGLSGSPEQVKDMMQKWRVYAAKVPTESGDYTMDHTATLYLMDANGEFVGTIAPGESDETALGKLRRLVS
ncbi:SCO family protein [Lutibaculum baratangense]|uniref:Cytochrome oxidase biogenesis protein Sco1/SenC/PrrC, putative copper metallochaperone n=1 Tax=Lutibaculum baratangense AMV1 TaxID=631454 RepID=V4RP57_9HYPH|nr:SCO family protein [Lutibaculum baratangense]ESR27054.1 Cytochrome oxidase biogenesis protein Sco1/SenC/PrrC, putative copper metallochaperone [Lutibaculum baratangense AMV1]